MQGEGTGREGTGREGSVVDSKKILKIDPEMSLR